MPAVRRGLNRQRLGARYRYSQHGPSAEPLAGHQWDMRMINATPTGSYTHQRGSKRVLVGVLDTGVDGNHPDIKPNFSEELSRNFTVDIPVIDGNCAVEPDASCNDPADVDENSHGTHVASTIASPINGLGIAGVAPDVTIVNLRAGQDSGFFFLQPSVDALTFAGDHGIDVVDMSCFIDPYLYNCRGVDERAIRLRGLAVDDEGLVGGTTPSRTVGNATSLTRCGVSRPATLKCVHRPSRLRPRMFTIDFSIREAFAARAQPAAAESWTLPVMLAARVSDDEMWATRHPRAFDPATPTVTRPLPPVGMPRKNCRKLTAWPLLPMSLVALSSRSPASDPSPNSALWRARYHLAAPAAVLARIARARNLPRLVTEDGVPNLLQTTRALIRLACARWSLVGAILPVRLSKSARPSACSWICATGRAEPGRRIAPRATARAAPLNHLSRISLPSSEQQA
jgi:Subtilase family